MRQRTVLLLVVMATAVVLAFSGVALAQTTGPDEPSDAPTGPRPASAEDPIPNRYIVVLDSKEDAKQAAKDAEKDHKAKIKHVYQNAIKGYAAELSDSEVDKLKKNNKHKVQFVEQDYKVHETQMSQTIPTGDERIDGEPNPTDASDGTGIGVAVIDTGIDLTHPDLTNVRDGTNCVKPGSPAQDDRGHGTHVAGTIAAENNASGVVGVAPGATLYAVKVLDSSGSGTTSQVICGIDWVTANAKNADGSQKIHVANMSLGGWVNSQSGLDDGNCGNTNGDSQHKAICRSTNAGVTYAVAAGNDAWPIEDKAYSYWSLRPAVYDEVLTTTAVADGDGQAGGSGTSKITCRSGETDDTPASFSNWSESTADEGHTIAGPGVCINSTYWRSGQTNQYATLSGTSMATPQAAGTAALYKAKNPSAAPAQLISALRSDAQGYDINNVYGFQKDPNSGMSSGWTSGTHKYYGYLALAGNYRSGVETPAPPPADTYPPTVSSMSPKMNATGVGRGTNVTATFSEAIDPTTLSSSTFKLAKYYSPTQFISATVTLSSDGMTATLNPYGSSKTTLGRCTWYTATVTNTVKDKAGNSLAADQVWWFKTRC